MIPQNTLPVAHWFACQPGRLCNLLQQWHVAVTGPFDGTDVGRFTNCEQCLRQAHALLIPYQIRYKSINRSLESGRKTSYT